MKTISNYSLKTNNSFSVDSVTPKIYFPSNLVELKSLSQSLHSQEYYLLGEGSNTLFFEEHAPTIVLPSFYGVQINETHDGHYVEVGASENWHELVTQLINNGIYGLENLALIPGTVGAAPVQNIGAYGKDVAMYCKQVEWFSMKTAQQVILNNSECTFAYRDSAFKSGAYQDGVITKVTFFFSKAWQPLTEYGELKELDNNVSAQRIMETVVNVRNLKLPNPKKLPNAGSFFKNPIVDNRIIATIKAEYPAIPIYKVDEQHSKLAAGWLIDQAGLKGFTQHGVGVHKKQALVLVNHQDASGIEIIRLAKLIQDKVFEKFNIVLEPEVRLVGVNGEQSLSSISVASSC